MTGSIISRTLLCAAIAVLPACNHEPPFTFTSDVGPVSTGSSTQLTFNPDQDYWPILTEDGNATLYAFVDASSASAARRHRCMGLMPIAGGTRSWQWCDNRFSQADTTSSFPAYALGSDGRLIYLESSVATRFPFAIPRTRLWLADSAHPYRRQLLDTFPLVLADSQVDALADIRWEGPDTFLALAQRWLLSAHCTMYAICPTIDSVFLGETVVRGTVAANGATLTAIPGTAGASGFAPAGGGAAIVFIRPDNASLFQVPAQGGVSEPVAIVTTRPGVQLTGVSCAGDMCIVSVAPITLWRPPDNYGSIGGGPSDLVAVSLASRTAAVVLSGGGPLSSPQLTASGDVIVQVGNMGRLQTFSTLTADLWLFRGLVR